MIALDSGDYDRFQALTDNAHDPKRIRKDLLQGAMNYLVNRPLKVGDLGVSLKFSVL